MNETIEICAEHGTGFLEGARKSEIRKTKLRNRDLSGIVP